jgi:hypothetical protein
MCFFSTRPLKKSSAWEAWIRPLCIVDFPANRRLRGSGMLATRDGQRGFCDAAWCSSLLAENSIYALLAQHGERIVCDEDFAECYSPR